MAGVRAEVWRAPVAFASACERLDKLEEAGLILRSPDANDRRMVVIELTPKGKRVIDAATATRFAEAKASLPPLSGGEMQTLAGLLRRWLTRGSEKGI